MESIIIKRVGKTYERDGDIRRLLCYIAGECNSKNERTHYCRGEGVSYKPEEAAEQMIYIQKSHKKVARKKAKRKCRRIYHYIVSFPPSMDDANGVLQAAVGIAGIFSEEYQVYYGVHEDKECLHIHFAINAVSYMSGKKWHMSMNQLEEMENEIRKTAKEAFGC